MQTESARKRPSPPRPGSRGLVLEVLRLIWREGEISRTDIARALDLSRSTVTEVARRLLESGIVLESGTAPSRGGRRPVPLRFRDDAACVLGLEMGSSRVTVTLVDLRGKVLQAVSRRHPVPNDPEGTRRLILELCEQCLEGRANPDQGLLGIGIGVPSPVALERPEILSPVTLPRWRGHGNLGELLARLQAPVLVDNDANLGALAEARWGAGRGSEDVVFLKVATGVGSGRVVDGLIARGATSEAGEIGHLVIDPAGVSCACGQRGCVNTVLTRGALESRATELRPEHPDTTLTARDILLEDIVASALQGDPLGRHVCDEAAEHLASTIKIILDLMNPGVVVIGGHLTRLGDRLLESIHRRLHQRSWVHSLAAVDVRVAALGSQTVAIGAATMVLDRAMEEGWLLREDAGAV